MTVREFKRLVASIPDKFDDYEVSSYTDIREITGIRFNKSQNLMWLEDNVDGVVEDAED